MGFKVFVGKSTMIPRDRRRRSSVLIAVGKYVLFLKAKVIESTNVLGSFGIMVVGFNAKSSINYSFQIRIDDLHRPGCLTGSAFMHIPRSPKSVPLLVLQPLMVHPLHVGRCLVCRLYIVSLSKI